MLTRQARSAELGGFWQCSALDPASLPASGPLVYGRPLALMAIFKELDTHHQLAVGAWVG